MPRFRKQVLAPHRYYVAKRDEHGTPVRDAAGNVEVVPYDVTAEEVREVYETQRAMLDAGVGIPVPLEHQFDALPLTAEERKARKVSHNAGFVAGAELDADGSLWNTVDVDFLPGASSDAEIAERLKKTVKFVSPYIVPKFKDGMGREWRKAICHLALTAQPVWSGQRPFGDDGARLMSLSHGISFSVDADWSQPICNQPGATDSVGSHEQRGIAMAFPPKKDDAEPKPAEPKAGEKPGGEAPPETPKPEQADPTQQAGDAASLKKIVAALAKRGLMVMGQTLADLAVSIETAVATAEGIEAKKDEADKPDLSQQTPGGGAAPTPSAPEPNMAMSQADFEALKTELATEKQARVALSQDLAQRQAAELISDVNALEKGGYLDAAVATQRRELIGAKALSLVTGDDPEIRDLRITIRAERRIAERAGMKQEAADLLKTHTGPTAMSHAVSRPKDQWAPDPKAEKEAQEKCGAEMAAMK